MQARELKAALTPGFGPTIEGYSYYFSIAGACQMYPGGAGPQVTYGEAIQC